jgi:hypothetical protein
MEDGTMKRFVWTCAALTLLACAAGPAQAGLIPGGGPPGPNPGPGKPVPGDPLYQFSISDAAGDTGFGTLNTVPDGLGDGGQLAVAGSLTMTGGALAGNTFALLSGGPGVTPSPSGVFIFDNLLYPANNAGNGANNGMGGLGLIGNPSFLDNGGLLFGGSGLEVNIWGNGGANNYSIFAFNTTNGSFPVSQNGGATFGLVPEPASLTLLGLGALGIAGYGWRRRKPAAA